jgi:hypothetical protein
LLKTTKTKRAMLVQIQEGGIYLLSGWNKIVHGKSTKPKNINTNKHASKIDINQIRS